MRTGRPQRPSPKKRQMSPSRTRSPVSTVSSSSRSPSPLSRQGTVTTYLTTGRRYREDATEASEEDAPFEHSGEQGGDYISPGVRYITEALIKKLSKQENLARITSLNLSLAKGGRKKFKYIENLEKCDKLEVLNLGNNLIEKIEKLDRLLKLCDLNLSYNKISKIEGIEQLHNLQKLNLAGNAIEHIPVWVGKKLRSLRILNLRHNQISSLHEVAKLKSLKDLASLFLADNPIVNLPHYRLYTIFHLRSLEELDGQPVTNCEREEALGRFNLEEVENLEKDLERTTKEMEGLKNKQSALLEQLQRQDDLNQSLKQKSLQQKQNCEELESELETKNELFFLLLPIGTLLHAPLQLKQKTVELTRACQKQYELEQELAFYKIDAKFEPLGYYYPVEDVELSDVPGESPYIGKAWYKRNMYAVEGYIPSKAQKLQVGHLEEEEPQPIQQLKRNLHQSLDVQLKEKEGKIKAAEEQLAELQGEVAQAERHVLEVTEELKLVQDAAAQQKMSEVGKEHHRQQLSNKILLLSRLREEALELEKQMERQSQEMANKEKELEGLQNLIDSLDPKDPKYAHMKAQKASREQQLGMMNEHYKHLEGRLDEMLSRIAKETEEIRDLEQQLTDGQIAANDALKKDLEGIIRGLQDYLESVKSQARQTSEECKELRKEKEALLSRLEEMEEERKQLEIVAMDAENLRKEMADLEQVLQEQRALNESLQEAQGELSAYEAELEAELKSRDAEAKQHKEELEKLKQLSQLQHATFQAELGKERQALKHALSKAQSLEEEGHKNHQLLSQLKQLQKDNHHLKEQLKEAQDQLNHAADGLIHPEEVLARVSELKRKLQTGAEIKCRNSEDVLGRGLVELQKQFGEILARSQRASEAAQARERALQKEVTSQQARLEEAQEKYRLACDKAAEAQIKSEKKQNEARVRQLEDEIQHLNEKLKSMEEIQDLADQQLQEADEEKERIFAQLEDLENRKKAEDARAQMQILGINKELKELKRAISASDKQATAELCAAKEQLKSLHGTVRKINQERAEELKEAEECSVQATQASKELAKAEEEIELLKTLLKEKEEQFQYEMEAISNEAAASGVRKEEIEKLNQLLKRQREEIDRLQNALDRARAGDREEIGRILEEIAALKHAIFHQEETIAGLMEPLRRRGHVCCGPLLSQSTKDSGVGLQYPTPTPVRRGPGEGKQSKKEGSVSPAARGCWGHTPFRSSLPESPSHRGKQEDGEANVPGPSSFVPPPGSVIYTLLPDGAPVPQGTMVYGPPPLPVAANGGQLAPTTVVFGPPPAGAQLLYSPLPANCSSVPLIPAGVLHCNIPEHHRLENEISRLEDIIDQLKSRRCAGGCLRASPHERTPEMEALQQDMQDLWNEREELKRQVAELRKKAQKRNHCRDVLDGHPSSLISELALEKSLQRHEDIVDEIECIEKTLLKRRAELQEADRLLAEAENECENTRGKTKDTIQKYNSAKQHLSRTEKEAKELERRAQDMAVRLVKADQQLRMLQADAKDLEQHKMEQEGILKEIHKVVSAKDSEFQSLSQKIEILTESLQKLQADIQFAEGNEDHHLQVLKEAENILQSKKSELERLKEQTAAQQQELLLLDRLLDQKREERDLLQDSIAQKNADLTEALREGEADIAGKRRQIKEAKSLLEGLSVQRGELGAQLHEKRAQLSFVTQDIQKEEANLQDVLGRIMKHKTELKHVLEMLQLENGELEGLKLQHSQKVDELESLQGAVLEEKLLLENLQRASQQQRGEAERQRQLLERTQQEAEKLSAQLHNLQSSIKALRSEKQRLEEDCQSLEGRLSTTKKTLASMEDDNKTALSSVQQMNEDIQALERESDQLQKRKKLLKEDVADLQKHLHAKKEELALLKTEVSDSRQQLQQLGKDAEKAARLKEELLREQAALKEDLGKYARKCRECQEAHRKVESQLQELCRDLEEQERERAEGEMILQRLREDVQREEKQLKECAAKQEGQKQVLEQAIARVQGAEERIRKLQEEESCCAALKETVGKTRQQLSEKERVLQEKAGEVASLQRQLEVSVAEQSALQAQIQAERKKAEKQIAGLKDAIQMQRAQLEGALQEQKQENACLQKEVASIEQVAQDNHQRAKRLMKDLGHIQEEYLALKAQMKSQEDLEKQQREIREAVKMLKLEVKDRLRTGLKDLSQSPPEPLEEEEEGTMSQASDSLQREWESLKENDPFAANEARMLCFEEKLDLSRVHITDEQWRGKARREQLQHHEDRLKARLRQCMSKQVEVLIKGKQQTEGTLHSLKRQVDALDELVSSTSSESLFPSLNSSLHEDLNFTRNQFARSPSRIPAGKLTPPPASHQYKA
ncbi:centriolin isoform X2 [Hemicordylus capensis]|uniref:centriolin isoform X2 n=1 Tax=Hemicordylus capensis TaxID=884348 RepID=UPI0023042F11|nr:centriolin isoform X2 [Hemicordylus capensis]